MSTRSDTLVPYTTLFRSPDHAGERERLYSAARILAGLQHFGGVLAFGKREWFLDDHRAPQRHRKQHAEQTAKSGDREYPRISEVMPIAEDDQRGTREDHAHADRRAGRGAVPHAVVFKHSTATKHPTQCKRNHRGRNSGPARP